METKPDATKFRETILNLLKEFGVELKNPDRANIQINLVRGDPVRVQVNQELA